jgi:hypothetical protein
MLRIETASIQALFQSPNESPKNYTLGVVWSIRFLIKTPNLLIFKKEIVGKILVQRFVVEPLLGT